MQGEFFSSLLAAVLTGFTGCATIVSQGNYAVSVSSEPPGAEATIRDEHSRLVHQERTPFQVDLDAHDGFFDAMHYDVRFEKVCYQPADASIDANLDEWYWGNLLFGGLIGFLLLDPGTGNMWEIDQDVSVVLNPFPECAPSTTTP